MPSDHQGEDSDLMSEETEDFEDEGPGACRKFLHRVVTTLFEGDVVFGIPKTLCWFIALTGVVGVTWLHVCEGFGWILSLYVVTQIFTTIGYGDFVVSTDTGRMFMALYVLWVLVVMSYVLNTLVQGLIEREAEKNRACLRELQKESNEEEIEVKMKWRSLNKLLVSGLIFLAFLLIGVLYYRFAGTMCALTSSGECCEEDDLSMECTGEAADKDHMNLVEAIYFSVITMTTVGFGDFSPKSRVDRLFGVVWMTGGVVATGWFLSCVQDYIFDYASMTKIEVTDLDQEAFDEADKDNDGFLTKGEFRSYILVKYGHVKPDIIQFIDSIYDELNELHESSGGLRNHVAYKDIERYQKTIKKSGAGVESGNVSNLVHRVTERLGTGA